jgi:drug/metabolite transporter (DMT)-like permease
MKNIKAYVPYLTGIGFAVIFGFSFMFSKIALEYATVLQLIGLRFLVAAVLFEALRLLRIVKFKLKFKDLKILIPIALFQPVLYFLGETYGINYSSSSMAGIVISLIPVTTAIISYFVLKEVLTKLQTVFLALSIVGIGLIGYMTLIDFKLDMMLGFLFLFVAVIAASIYSVLSRKASGEFDAIKITYVMMVFGAIVFNIIGFTHSRIAGYPYFAPFMNLRFDISILYLGAISSIIAYFLMNYTVSKMPATQFSLFANLATVISIIAGAVFLKEQIFIYQIIGSVLIILGVWGVNFFRPANKSKK